MSTFVRKISKMISKELTDRLYASCHNEDILSDLTHWIALGVCPKCYSEDILCNEGYLYDFNGEAFAIAVDFECWRDTCMYSRNYELSINSDD